MRTYLTWATLSFALVAGGFGGERPIAGYFAL
jgi:uncharacterized membrane protein YidH (DUF202 family)